MLLVCRSWSGSFLELTSLRLVWSNSWPLYSISWSSVSACTTGTVGFPCVNQSYLVRNIKQSRVDMAWPLICKSEVWDPSMSSLKVADSSSPWWLMNEYKNIYNFGLKDQHTQEIPRRRYHIKLAGGLRLVFRSFVRVWKCNRLSKRPQSTCHLHGTVPTTLQLGW